MEAKQFRSSNAILACLQGTTAHPGAETLYAMVKAETRTFLWPPCTGT